MDGIISTLFSPIDSKKYCDYYYYLELFYFSFFVGTIATMMIGAYHKKMTNEHYAVGIGGLVFKLLMYLQCRLLYSMCVK